ncbi:MAG: putative Glycosyl transferase, family 2 [Promethearchaeota archaeon]|nr:MAG: putative Glycosyl transferase, family 2 [Candidatus Lokiarchaeota archaeon]
MLQEEDFSHKTRINYSEKKEFHNILFSAIIITLNEKNNILKTIQSIREAAIIGRFKIPVEIIISDGGSTDGTLELIKGKVDQVVISQANRSNQLNVGGNKANGDFLLFLHADTLLPKGALVRIYMKLRHKGDVIGGAFKKKWKWNKNIKISKFLKSLHFFWEGFGNWLTQLLHIFPGDNAIFVRRDIFHELGGFQHIWLCEDLDFSRRMKNLGKKRRVLYIRDPVHTSTRRFETYGYLRVLYLWFAIYFFWRVGMDPERIRIKYQNYAVSHEEKQRAFLKW